MTKKNYIIGTRGSLLALTQCGQVKDQLEKLTGDSFELKVIKTQGDQIVDKPLWQLEGKDFFTKELDEQLLLGKIDLVVHSYKDLGSIRPEGIKLAAITKRKFAHDILFIKKSTIEKLNSLTELVVGTSSPRRIVNIEKNLAKFLPNGNNLKISTKMLRGNVNSRIQKLKDDNYDAIVLAMPGIERLALTESSKVELIGLLDGLDFMILPQSVFPAAASQGALAIECLDSRDDNGELSSKLKMMEDKHTVSEIIRERTAFASYGGGCHLAVGINVSKIGDYYLHSHQGSVDGKEISYKLLEGSFARPDKKTKCFVGLPVEKLDEEGFVSCKLLKKTSLKVDIDLDNDLFVTTNYGIDNLDGAEIKKCLFTAGTRTWRALAKKGHWVNGSSDSLGEDYLNNLRDSKLIEIMKGSERNLLCLTHEDSYSKSGNIQNVYSKETLKLSATDEASLLECDVFYWTSFTQFKTYTEIYPTIKDAFHCSGLGKTFEQFKENAISIRPFASMDEFRNWYNEK